MKHLFLFLLAVSSISAADVQNSGQTFLPISSIKSQSYDAKQVWVKGTLIEKHGNDEYYLQDDSDIVILFLPTDELIARNIPEGTKVQVLGTVDYSPVSRNRTELDANKIIVVEAAKPAAPKLK